MRPTLLLTAALLAGALSADAARAQPTERAAVFASASHFRSAGIFRCSTCYDFVATTARIGAEVPVFRRAGLVGTVGVAFQAASFANKGIGSRSGVRPQSVEPTVRLAGPLGPAAVAVTAGYVFDIGPRFNTDIEETQSVPNSDTQDAVRLGLDATLPAGRLRLLAGAERVWTIPETYVSTGYGPNGMPEGTTESDADDGDYLIGLLGASVAATPAVEVGLSVVAMRRNDLVYETGEAGGTVRFRRNVVGLAPHVRVAPAGTALQIEVTAQAPGGGIGEHGRYGFSIAGDGEPRVWLPLTLGVRYAL